MAFRTLAFAAPSEKLQEAKPSISSDGCLCCISVIGVPCCRKAYSKSGCKDLPFPVTVLMLLPAMLPLRARLSVLMSPSPPWSIIAAFKGL